MDIFKELNYKKRLLEEIIKKQNTLNIENAHIFKIIAEERKKRESDYMKTKYIIEYASTFNLYDIGLIIQEFISYFENKDYLFHNSKLFLDEIYLSNGICSKNKKEYNLFMISSKDNLESIYFKRQCPEYDNTLLNENKHFIFYNTDSKSKTNLKDLDVTFYPVKDYIKNKNNHFYYVYDFINFLINYKVDNKINNLNYNELKDLLKLFLLDYKKNLNNNVFNKVLK